MKQMGQNIDNSGVWVMCMTGFINTLYYFLLLCIFEHFHNKFETMIILYACRWESFIPRILGVHIDSWIPTLTPQPPGVRK